MALSAAAEVNRFTDQDIRDFPMSASVKIWKGALVGLHPVSGLAKPYSPPDIFVGVSYETVDNSSGAASAENVRVFTRGDFEMTVTGVADSDSGKAVYAVSDDPKSASQILTTGHPDAFVGRIVHKFATNTAVVRLRGYNEVPGKHDDGSLNYVYNAQGANETGATAGNQVAGDFALRTILGPGTSIDEAQGGVRLRFDAVAEVAQASMETPAILSITKGISAEFVLNAEDIGDDAALDMDWGIGNVIDATTRADMDDATLTKHARFHMDGNSANILAESDDATTDVAAADTTIDNAPAAGSRKRFNLIAYPSGTVEFWIDGSQVLSSTTFGVSNTGTFAGFINLEKTSNNTLAEIVCSYARVAGGRA